MNTLIRWNPIREMSSFQDEMDKVFSDVFGRRWLTEEAGKGMIWQPPVDVEEQPDRYVIHVELPGMKLEDIKITLEDNRLLIRGEKTRTEEKQNATYHRLERVYGAFERSFTLTHAVKPDKIEATYRDGVLEVTVPKAEEAKAREIPINAAR